MTGAPDPVLDVAREVEAARAENEAAYDRVCEAEAALPKGHPAQSPLVLLMIDERHGADNPDTLRSICEHNLKIDPTPYVEQWQRLHDERMAERKRLGIDDEARKAAYDRMEEARAKLAATPATTLAGLKVKVAAMCEYFEGPPGSWEEALPRGIVADMERLIG